MINYGLKDRVALITGANNPQGIGATTALAFAREGAKVVLVYKKVFRPFDPTKADRNGVDRYYQSNAGDAGAVVEKLQAMHADYLVLESDISSEASVREIYAAVMERYGRIDILVATDIVSRGIDIDDIRLVINYDAPRDCEDYVHRIGRTARAGAEGCAITFVAVDDQSRFAAIEEFIGREVHKLPVPEELGEAPEYNPKKSAGRGKGGRGGRRGGHRGGKGKQESAQGHRRSGKPHRGGKKKGNTTPKSGPQA